MTAIEQFEQEIEAAIKNHPEIPYEDLADSLEYYADECLRKHNRENEI